MTNNKSRTQRKAERITWSTIRKKSEPDYNVWYNNPQPDTRTKDQIRYDNERNRNGKIAIVLFFIITIVGIIAVSR